MCRLCQTADFEFGLWPGSEPFGPRPGSFLIPKSQQAHPAHSTLTPTPQAHRPQALNPYPESWEIKVIAETAGATRVAAGRCREGLCRAGTSHPRNPTRQILDPPPFQLTGCAHARPYTWNAPPPNAQTLCQVSPVIIYGVVSPDKRQPRTPEHCVKSHRSSYTGLYPQMNARS